MEQVFKFRLQKILDMKISLEEQSKIEFRKAVSDIEDSKLKIKQLEEKFSRYSCFNGKEDTVDRKLKLKYLDTLSRCIDNENSELDSKKMILEEKREMLKNKQIERKIVETLKDKQRQQFIQEQNMIEQKNNDEFALYAYVRKNLKGGDT
ncbi:flagellar biosynthesis chaperone [Clostridium tepidiprofundi DSM 19306]|uniref:Flagellar FliJ protein n=1 Tax=Clostridium tepidiprofundi DSM 19306 TaxID=1121338 RepID=A0A151B5B8_9CLOT|nr:flagellar export protein FliJ [Clostridium tepidiprofundi]KYH35076.1 flagellar biosynthesis chaperone [Clostridium tepidiprofundi DSM 19306]